MAPLVLVLDQGGHSSRALVLMRRVRWLRRLEKPLQRITCLLSKSNKTHRVVQSLRDVVAAVSVQWASVAVKL